VGRDCGDGPVFRRSGGTAEACSSLVGSAWGGQALVSFLVPGNTHMVISRFVASSIVLSDFCRSNHPNDPIVDSVSDVFTVLAHEIGRVTRNDWFYGRYAFRHSHCLSIGG
jgi:hypothetical protein